MENFLNQSAKMIVLDLIEAIQKNSQYLSEIDGAIGDGDHGVNMSKGFTKAGEALVSGEMDFSEALYHLGDTLLVEIGGAMGPLYGTFFMDMGTSCKDKKEIDKNVFSSMLEAGVNGVQDIGNAKVGDKTLLDTLIPAKEAFEKALSEGRDFSDSLKEMDLAAKRGMESTKDMIAKIGRASRLGERSRGHQDAGATSCYVILNSLATSIQRIIN